MNTQYDTLARAIAAAQGFIAETKTPRLPGGQAPDKTSEWLRWHRIVSSRADGNRSRLGSNILQGSPEEVEQARALQAELQDLAARHAVEAEKFIVRWSL